ncbi:hypothetical protein L0664_11590 [Octadecabacter sp. G9-8]|uniref:Peptidase inhibitor I78 family protein n=1 Tax=Octadecabacter dasysiphoniae TaxID=2909341 RepID=A0ABS9CZ96_9RHOB|nr:I78 family peptidase inhibitor [Octadecabacter dasysiphoniae]MCF2871710.1 hypothetical protein [Octadecabacter dasysiphoniae]
MRKLFAIAPFVFLAACGGAFPSSDTSSDPVLPSIAEDTCNANQYASLVGQDVTALERVMILDQVRVIRPGQAVTMDFRPERINFNIGQDSRITSINCS